MRSRKQNKRYIKTEEPLVSVLIRTCGRPQVLKRALESIRGQTYPNLEVVIVEDGMPTAQKMLQTDYADFPFPCLYEATGKHVGRSRAGNRAMQLSSGKYLNFLDDDDGLLPDHVECLVRALSTRTEQAAYSVAQERQVTCRNGRKSCAVKACKKAGERQRVRKQFVRYRQKFNRLLLYTDNYIPIQSILFERSLFERFGGFDEELGAFEDWDLWVRYSLCTDFVYVDRVTSYYYVPYARKKKKERAVAFHENKMKLDRKFQKYKMQIAVSDIHKEMLYVLRHYKEKKLIRYLRLFFRVVLLGER